MWSRLVRTRWANGFTGFCSVLIVLTVASVAAHVPLSVDGGMLIIIGINAIDPAKLRLVWMVVSLLAVLVDSAAGVAVHEVVQTADCRWLEQPAPGEIGSNSVMVFRVHGFLYFAGVESIEKALAPALSAHKAAVILRLHKYQSFGSTNIAFLERFAHAMHERGNLVLLADVEQSIRRELAATTVDEVIGVQYIFSPDDSASSLEQAWTAANAWCSASMER